MIRDRTSGGPRARGWLTVLCGGLSALATAAAATAAPARPPGESPAQVVQAYVAAVTRGDWDGALSCWSPEDLARAGRLGISYRDVPLKVDSASPLLLRRDELAAGVVAVRIGPAAVAGARARIAVALATVTDSLVVDYHLARTAGGWRLISPASALAADWPVRETAFLRLHEQPPRCLPAAAAARMDSLVARVCRELGAPPERVARLRREKLDYYLADAETVGLLAGAPTVGVALLQSDAVVTSEPCHLHELAHLLVNFCAGEVGLYALPLLQEGAAVHFGGRWGRAPDALREMGCYALATGLVGLDGLLARDGFERNPADLTYAPAGLVAGLLLERLGPAAFLELYRGTSGSLAQSRSLSADRVRSRLAEALGVPFAAFAADLAERAREPAGRDLAPAPPGGAGAGEDTLARVECGSLRATVTGRGEWLLFDIVSTSGEAAGALLPGGGAPAGERCAPGPGRLAAEQLPGGVGPAETAAVIFSPREIGWYDFACDLLLAKHVEEFRPAAGFASDDGRRLTFRIHRSLLPAPPDRVTWRLERQAISP